ncbi:MAG: quinone-dependent dihydroorotate dehydrogenase [Thermonemataceae bacterium]|nr:quinone-dependent dihydroorotate dehydrogenase [Thermonemataceae bacterium]
MYKYLLRPLLFQMQAEKAHHFTFSLLKFALNLPFAKTIAHKFCTFEDKRLRKNLMGLEFPNPVGLAAGLDKNAMAIDELAALGFGFIEIGTLTPKAQEGNPQPRLFRLLADEAIINRMGFNNDGIEIALERLKKRKSKVIVGGNIGKNKVTPNEEAINDYTFSFQALFDWVDYFVVNVSSPNTPNLRALQEKEPLKALLSHLQNLNYQKAKPKPILLKIAPDLSDEQLDDIIEIVIDTQIAGIIATNTTLSRNGLQSSEKLCKEAGGLSGKPLAKRSTEVISYIARKSQKKFVIIGVGGIHSPEDAWEKISAGADLVQIYTGFVYEGASLIKSINKFMIEKIRENE